MPPCASWRSNLDSCARAHASSTVNVRPAAFELRAASVVYQGRPALATADLVIEAGEALALVGPSGAGKTTLLRLLNGTLSPSAGSVLVDATELARLSPRELRRVRARVGFVHQDLALVPNVRAAANVLAGRIGTQGFLASLRTLALPSRAELAHVHALLARVGIGDKLFQRTDSLSGGQRQRVAIARALYQQPAALLADEPVSSVDPARARDTVALLRELCSERGLTLVISLHDLGLAREFFPRLVGMRAGEIVFDRATSAIDEREFGALYALDDGGRRDDEL